jgi:hypothetical protein
VAGEYVGIDLHRKRMVIVREDRDSCWAWIDYGFVDECTNPDEVITRLASGVDSPWGTDGIEWDRR